MFKFKKSLKTMFILVVLSGSLLPSNVSGQANLPQNEIDDTSSNKCEFYISQLRDMNVKEELIKCVV